MLLRTFRLTDKLSNAGLKLAIYATALLLLQAAALRQALTATFWALTLSAFGLAQVGTRRMGRLVQRGYRGQTQTQQRVRQVMVQRAEQTALARQKDLEQGKVIEDPLVVRNRSLSAMTVILLLALIAFLFLSPGNQAGRLGGDGGGIIPPAPVIQAPAQIPSPTASPSPANTLLSDLSGTLVLTLRQGGQEDLWALPVGTSQPVRLTDSLEDDRDPAWSPDGGKIAFSSRRDGFWNLYLIDLVAGQTRQLTFGQDYVGAPSWSPDGQFLAFEAYNPASASIDIFLISQEGQIVPRSVTSSPYPDLSPAWSPGGREIAFIGWRNDNFEVLVINLDGQPEAEALNISNSPDLNESTPRWSPDGRRLSYVANPNGIEGVYVQAFNPEGGLAAPRLIGRGGAATWNPLDGTSLFYTVPQGPNSAVYLGQVDNFGVGANAISFAGQVKDLDWTASQHSLSGFDPRYPPLYTESLAQDPGQSGRFGLIPLQNLELDDPFLSDAVNDSFEALRQRLVVKTGVDVLGRLEGAYWRRDRLPEPGQDRRNWHYAGRAISLPRDLVLQGNPAPLVVLREETEFGTYWRVMARAPQNRQDGSLGEPLRALPWDFGARFTDNPTAFEGGGQLMANIPPGYYVDLTQIMADYGWERSPADRTWRQNYGGVLFWQFQKTDGLTWEEAMLQIYSEQEVAEFEAGILPPPPTPLPTLTLAPGLTASPTGILATPIPTRTPSPEN
jgi:TolB protein